jgi:hypothetical protein
MSEIIRIPNIENYNQEIINGELILTPKKVYISEDELNNTDIRFSNILECIIKKGDEVISSNRKKYRPILIDVWKHMSIRRILQTTTFNCKLTNDDNNNSYNWCSDINMYFQNQDAKNTLKEIIEMVKENELNINLSIKLQTGNIIYFKID